jgi:PHP family Zn ribbon phosphoesterase
LFLDSDTVYNVQDIIFEHLPSRENKASIFGKQLLFNEEDDVIGEETRLLSFATDLSIDDILDIANEYKGVMIPAHIDRPSYSIISNLGMIPENLTLTTLEISRHNELEKYVNLYNNYRVIQNSDAHDLGYIGTCDQYIELKENTAKILIEELRKNWDN